MHRREIMIPKLNTTPANQMGRRHLALRILWLEGSKAVVFESLDPKPVPALAESRGVEEQSRTQHGIS
jgi:hypothetical protein